MNSEVGIVDQLFENYPHQCFESIRFTYSEPNNLPNNKTHTNKSKTTPQTPLLFIAHVSLPQNAYLNRIVGFRPLAARHCNACHQTSSNNARSPNKGSLLDYTLSCHLGLQHIPNYLFCILGMTNSTTIRSLVCFFLQSPKFVGHT